MKLKTRDYLSLITFVALFGLTAHAQTFSVIHTFQGTEGSSPGVGVTLRGGILYGTANGGWSCGMGASCGTAYQVKQVGANWIANVIFQFPTKGSGAGYPPSNRVVFGPDGHLYGFTDHGFGGFGTVYRLTPPPSICRTAACLWASNELHTFTDQGGDGAYPSGGDLIWDQQGNMYGTTYSGGQGFGTVFQMTGSGNNWTEAPIYSFTFADGAFPDNGVVVDSNGNLFGTTFGGGTHSNGTVYELTYDPEAGWTESALYSFPAGSKNGPATGGVILDNSGNLYGTTPSAVFELSPSGNNWTFKMLYQIPDGWGAPSVNLTLDAAGNLYGTMYSGGVYNKGSIFKLSDTDNGWVYTSLHDFTGGADGAFPMSQVTIDTDGTLYGSASQGGGFYNAGVVWMIKP